ncbi:unnamed protein product [Mesocestoides corti]|uniref:Uncharacterized protein n=1 Tax=Mesocestoides corti TaxID=53468 RepID=A0A0R3UAG2_MESCO|nr:unnamed protein product [Mesocestoides corti]
MRSLTNLSLSLLLLLLLFTHTRMVVGSDEVESQRLESGQVEEVDVEPVDAANSMLGSGGDHLADHDQEDHDLGDRDQDVHSFSYLYINTQNSQSYRIAFAFHVLSVHNIAEHAHMLFFRVKRRKNHVDVLLKQIPTLTVSMISIASTCLNSVFGLKLRHVEVHETHRNRNDPHSDAD